MRCSTIFSIKFQIGQFYVPVQFIVVSKYIWEQYLYPSLKLFTGFLLTLFLWGEWASNELYAYLYWPLPGNGEIKILIIADPQLIGYQNENRLIGSLTRWDADRLEFPMVIILLQIFIPWLSSSTKIFEYERLCFSRRSF